MGKRRKARELALQLLYQLDVQDEGSPVPHFDEFWSRHPVDLEVREFTEGLVRGTKLHEGKIDELISQYTEHWEIERMAVVDRNILRQGIFELLWGADDRFVTAAYYGSAYRAAIPGAKFETIDGAGHFPHIEEPRAFAERVRGFLAERKA